VQIDRATFRRLCRARALLYALDEPLSVSAIARQLEMSPFQLIRRAHAVFGATPHQLRIEARLAEAKRRLALEQQSVTEVCMALGFASLGSFSSAFTRRVGATPSGYRRQVRTLVQVPAQLTAALAPGCLSLMAQLPPDAFRNFREA
jgi:AraC-like DNA-binding protein